MKKYVALLLCGLMLAGCAQGPDHSAEFAQLRQELSELRGQVAALEEKVALLEAGAVAEWSLTGTPLTEGSGAAITLRVVPTVYREGQLAQLRVLLEGKDVAQLYCDWDGSAYTARVDLDAADGYSYHLILSDPQGDVERIELNSPENPTDPRLVYLDSSLNASCMLNVFEWHRENDRLLLDAGTAQVQLPSLTATGEAAVCSAARLILLLDGQELESRELTVSQPEENAIYIGINGLAFSMPELEEGSQLDLILEVTLSDGQLLTHSGSSWYLFEGELIQAVG